MIPKPVTTVPAAISSGIAAATGLRNTSSRTRIRIGAAISSPLCSASIEDSFTSLPSDGIPARWARTGGCTWASTNSSSGPMTVLMLPPGGIRRSTLMAASPRARPQRPRPARRAGLQGEIARVPARRWSASASRGPWRSISRAGPDEQDDQRLVEAALAHVAPVDRLRAGDEQQRRLHLVLDAPADQPERRDDEHPADEHRHGVPNREAGDRGDQPSSLASRRSVPGATDVPPSFAAWPEVARAREPNPRPRRRQRGLGSRRKDSPDFEPPARHGRRPARRARLVRVARRRRDRRARPQGRHGQLGRPARPSSRRATAATPAT